MNSILKEKKYDVLIVGGGMVGLTLASALGGSRLNVGVIEAVSPGEISLDAPYELRVSALSRATQQVFQSLGAWDGIARRRISPFSHMHVWDATGSGKIDFDAQDMGVDVLGHIVENRVVQIGLLETLKSHANVDWLCPSKVSGIEYRPEGSRVALEDGAVLTSRLLVGADGADSRVRDAAGISVDIAPYQQKGVVCVVKSQHHHRFTAWQRFLPNGPLAFLPLADGTCSIVWSTLDAEADELMRLDDDAFCRRLEQAFEFTLGEVESIGPRGAFPLKRRHAQCYVQQGVALIGDAAHTIHPLAGQGVNLGSLDAASLAEVLLEADKNGRDIASMTVLRRYERWRRGENTLMMYSMSGFKELFSNNPPALRLLRNFGLSTVDRMTPLKNQFMRRAMGLDGDLPRLAKVVGW